MNDDRRAGQKPRVKPRPDVAEGTRRAARTGAESERAGLSTASGTKPKQVARAYSGQDERKVAQRLYPDDAYYKKGAGGQASQKRRPQSAKSIKLIKRKKRKVLMRSLGYSVMAILAAMLVGFLLRTFVFEVVQVSSDAMYQALEEGDWVLVTKFDYWTAKPERGDIIAVSVKGEESGMILRRVVGMPGESIAIDGNGDTFINGVPLGERYVTLKNYEEYKETVLNGGHYFVMSDNRTVKLDSRSEKVNSVPKPNIIGKVRTILWPLGSRGNL